MNELTKTQKKMANKSIKPKPTNLKFEKVPVQTTASANSNKDQAPQNNKANASLSAFEQLEMLDTASKAKLINTTNNPEILVILSKDKDLWIKEMAFKALKKLKGLVK